MFETEQVLGIIKKYDKHILLGVIIFLQLILVLKVSYLRDYYQNMDMRMSNIQTLLGISNTPDTQKPILEKGLLNPADGKKVMLPARPTSFLDIAYIEKGYTQMDNYYPVGKEIIYAVHDEILEAGNTYKLQLLNTGWQVLDIKNENMGGKTYVKSLKATNGQSDISVNFEQKIPNYSKKAGSFIKIILER